MPARRNQYPDTVEEQIADIYERLRRIYGLLGRLQERIEICGTLCLDGSVPADGSSDLLVSKTYIDVVVVP